MKNKLSKIEELQLTHNAFEQLQHKLRQTQGEKFKGISSIAEYLVNYYFTFYYNVIHPSEYEYFSHYKMAILFVEVRHWLSHSKEMRLRGVKIKKLLTKAEEKLQEEREELYTLWINNQLDKESKVLKWNIENAENSYYKHCYTLKNKMVEDLIKYYPEFDENKIVDFKKDIGLC